MKKQRIFPVLVVVLTAALFLVGYVIHIELSNSLDFPKNEAGKNCEWIKRIFSRAEITFWEKNCPTPKYESDWTFFEDETGKVILDFPTQDRQHTLIETLSKNASTSPIDIMNESWYGKLTPEQKVKCEIHETNYDGWHGGLPQTTPHKVRYEIRLRKQISDMIDSKYDGLPMSRDYDYLCGTVVGSTFRTFPPYFEFDDKSPTRYLFVHPTWPDGLFGIDADTIRF